MGFELPGMGEGGGGGKSQRSLLLVGGIGLALLLLFRRRGAAPAPATAAAPSGNGEFARLVAANSQELERLRVDASLQMQSQQLQYQLSAGTVPGLLRSFVSADAYGQLSRMERQQLDRQVREGKVIRQPTSGGWFLTPTSEGLAGHAPPTRSECKTTLFGTRCKNVGLGQAPVGGRPAIVDLTKEAGKIVAAG